MVEEANAERSMTASDLKALPPLTQIEIDQRVFDLYDEYCHGRMIAASSCSGLQR